jgi:hypothetical protein
MTKVTLATTAGVARETTVVVASICVGGNRSGDDGD